MPQSARSLLTIITVLALLENTVELVAFKKLHKNTKQKQKQ